MKPLYVFLDTNIFLHFRPFDEVKWIDIFGAPYVVLVTAPVVVRELDQHKDQHPLSKIRDRARTTLKKIERIGLGEVDTTLPKNTKLEYAKEPGIDFQQHGLSREVNDDHLIASCLTYRELEPSARIVVVSDDTGPRLKSRQHGFEVVSLPEEYKLPSALDAVEKERRQLQRRVQQLENRFPKLKLAFANEADRFNATVLHPFTMAEEDIQR